MVITAHSGLIWQGMKDRFKVDFLILAVLALTLTGVTVFATRTVVGQPVAHLRNAIERTRDELVCEKVEWESDDELGRVVEAYNDMQTYRAEAERALSTYQKNLENLAEERAKELTVASQKLQVALDTMSDGIYLLDVDLRFALINDRYLELVELPEGAIGVGMHIEPALRAHARRGDYGEGDVEEIMASV